MESSILQTREVCLYWYGDKASPTSAQHQGGPEGSFGVHHDVGDVD